MKTSTTAAVATTAVAMAGLGVGLGACGSDDTPCPTITQGTGGEGAAAQGGGGEGGGGTGGTQALGAPGDPCKADADCAGGLCLSEAFSGWAQGYCSEFCSMAGDPPLAACPADASCVAFADFSGCFQTCTDPSDCEGVAQECFALDETTSVCVGGCSEDEQCEVACDNDSLLCSTAAEDCGNKKDDDEDGMQDCEEMDCAEDTTCVASIADACSNAVDVSAGGTFAGKTTGGTNVFAAVCSGFFGSYVAGGGYDERVYQYTAAGDVVLGLELTTSDMVDWYLRSDCDDPTSLLGCLTEANTSVSLELTKGQTVFVTIDGYEGAVTYSLEVTTTDPAEVCKTATTINLGTTNGDTTDGSAAFTSSCAGGGKEKLYRFTPTKTGDLKLTLKSVSDQGLHVRTDCAKPASEIGCVDDMFNGEDEKLTVAVTKDVPVTIFVDAYGGGSEGPFSLILEM